MHPRILATLAICTSLLVVSAKAQTGAAAKPDPAAAKPAAAVEANDGKATLFMIPHIHWEGAVFKTREEYLDIGLPFILKALHLLQAHPEYRFVLDQMAYVKPFLDRYPEQEAAFRKLVEEGRLQLVAGNITMHDVNMPSGESFIRHVLYGKGYYREKLGVDVTVGWALDTFGHHAQVPQLLKRAGYNSYWFMRGVPSLETPAEFLWKGLDGTEIPAFWLVQTYVDFHDVPANESEFERFTISRYRALDDFTHYKNRVAMAGADVAEPDAHLPAMVKQFNESADAPFSIRFAVPTDFEKEVAGRSDRPVVEGELNPIFQGVYSSRIEVKQWMRNLERILTNAEKFSVLADWLGAPTDRALLAEAWDPVLFNQAHDIASGVMVDKVYDDTIRSNYASKRIGDRLVDTYLGAVSAKIDTRGDGTPIAVFNTLGWTRNDIVEVVVGFSQPGVVDVALSDSQGRPVPVQLAEVLRQGDDGLRQARVAFIARDVPALGYAVFHLAAKTAGQPGGKPAIAAASRWAGTNARGDFGTLENDDYRATFQLWTGELTSLVHKATNWEVLGKQPGNVVAREEDGGDFWELEGNLNGARMVAMTKKQLTPVERRSVFSNDYVGGSGSVSNGPVFSEFHVHHPFGEGLFATTARLYAGLPRLEFRTRILNNDKLVRYRALFPTSIRGGKVTAEIPFGALERPTEQELPAQYWINYGDGTRGVALLNRGLPGNNVAGDTLMVSLLRSARIQAYAYHGGYEAGVSSDSGLQLGREFTLDYALLPHTGDWREAQVYRAGWEFNHPLVVRKLTQHAGALPKSWGLLDSSHPNVVVSSLKQGPESSTILRVYEAAGQAAQGVKIKFHAGIQSAHEANLMEDSMQSLTVRDDTLEFDIKPFEIRTFKLQLEKKTTQ